jgi:hypothetical protein
MMDFKPPEMEYDPETEEDRLDREESIKKMEARGNSQGFEALYPLFGQ